MTHGQVTRRERRERARVERLMAAPNAIFVFGSNLAGIHGAGAAKEAARIYGAVKGIGDGMAGRSYAIPTKRNPMVRLSLMEIQRYAQRLVRFATSRGDLCFVVTRFGCGFAHYRDKEIAPLLRGAPENCELPEGWRELLALAEDGR